MSPTLNIGLTAPNSVREYAIFSLYFCCGVGIFLFLMMLVFLYMPSPMIDNLGRYTGNIAIPSEEEEEYEMSYASIRRKARRQERDRKEMINDRFWIGRDRSETMQEQRQYRERQIKSRMAQDIKFAKRWKAWKAKQAKQAKLQPAPSTSK